MTRTTMNRALLLALLVTTVTSATAAAQTSTPATGRTTSSPQAAQGAAGEEFPVSPEALERIRKGVAADPTLKLNTDQLRYYVQILAKAQSFVEFTKGYNWKDGATRGGNPMTHQEFLNMVTPKEMYSSAGITPTDLLQFAVTNWLGQALVKKALSEIGSARSERELQQIRDRIDRELAILRRGGTN